MRRRAEQMRVRAEQMRQRCSSSSLAEVWWRRTFPRQVSSSCNIYQDQLNDQVEVCVY